MSRRVLLLSALVLAAFVVVPLAAYFDELSSIKAELVAWQTTHDAADFSDLYHTLDQLAAPTFRDISDDAWYAQYVNGVASLGIVSGYKDAQGELTGDFGPGNPVSIAEMLKIAFKAAKVDENTCNAPPTIPQAFNHWSLRFVSCAEERGLRLLRDRALNLDRQATRAEVLAILDDATGQTPKSGSAAFNDAKGHPFEADIAQAAQRGVVSGDKDKNGEPTGTFRPDAPVVRAEVTKIIYQWLQWQSGQGSAVVAG